MSTKIFIVALFILELSCVSCDYNTTQSSNTKINSDNVFATIGYDKVIAYDYNGEGEIEIVNNKGQLAKKIKKKVVLNKLEIISLTNGLCDNSMYGGTVAACFEPHLGIVFYKVNKPIAWISICLDCNFLVSSIKIPAAKGGFSDKGINQIINFEKAVHLN